MILAISLALLTSACGGGGTPTVGPPELASIAVTPLDASISLGATQSFSATGTYTDGSTQDLTSSVTWSSSNAAVATISNAAGTKGVASSTGLGSTTITASSGSRTGLATLTVTAATLVSISLAPQSPAVSLGMNQQFTATGTYSDSSTQNITDSVVWTSATQTVATISNASGSQGLATSVGAGTSKITATVGSLFSSTILTVNPVVSAPTWSQEGPVARFAHSTVFDPTTQQMVIFGGQQPDTSTNLNDVWLAATTLTPSATLTYSAVLPTGTAPSPRFGHVATYDQNSNRMTLFGGGEGLPGPCAHDVWILDGANGQTGTSTWLPMTPSGTAPNARVHHTGVYDPGSNTLTVFGGNDCGSGFFNDVWVLSNANGEGGTPTWTQLHPSGSLPPARESSTAIYDSTSHIMTIYGGDAGGAALGDVWVLSNANGQGTPAWNQLSPTGTAPPPRSGHSAVYDTSSDRMSVFGGLDGTLSLADSWILTFANGLGGAPAWIQLSVQGTAPNVQFHSAVYDPTSNSMYVFAGTSSGAKLQTSNHMFTLTEANGVQSGNSQWFIAGPPVRYSQSAFYDSSTGSLFVFGGQHSFNINFNDYERDSGVIASSNAAWTKLTVTGPAPAARFGHTGLYDSASNRMMVFGGGLGGPGPCANDYWILKQANAVGGTPTWTSVSPSGSAPAPRMRHSSVYDTATNSLIIFGGFDCTSTYFNDVWRLSNANDSTGTPAWTHVVPSGTPPSARQASAAVYDAATNSLILFGGGAGASVFSDVWVLSNANGSGGAPTWTQLTVASSGPAARTGHSAVYDSQNSRMIIYGGVSGSAVFDDTWILSDANGVGGTPTWTQLTPVTPGPPRYDHSAVYDPVSNQMTIFGGVITTNPLSPDANVFSLSDANGLP